MGRVVFADLDRQEEAFLFFAVDQDGFLVQDVLQRFGGEEGQQRLGFRGKLLGIQCFRVRTGRLFSIKTVFLLS